MSLSTSRKLANGSGSVEKHLDGYRIYWTAPEGRRSKVLRHTSRTEATRVLNDILADIRRGDYRDERAGNVLFSDFLGDYLKVREREVREGVYRNWRTYHRKHLIPAFGGMRMRDITPRHIALWWAENADHPVNRKNIYRHLKTIFSLAIEWGVLETSPCRIKSLGKDAQRPDWTVQDFDEVLGHVDPFYRAPLEVMFAGHLRLGELIALNGSDYRPDGMLTITKQLTDMGLTTETKTRQRKTVKLLQRGVDALSERPRVIGASPLFAGERAARMPRNSLRRAWSKAVEASGRDDFHLHDLRHISLSLVAEVSHPKIVQERAGHASATSTLRYIHSDVRQHLEAVERVDALITAISPQRIA